MIIDSSVPRRVIIMKIVFLVSVLRLTSIRIPLEILPHVSIVPVIV